MTSASNADMHAQEPSTATVIPFPVRPAADTVQRTAAAENDRLRLALAALQAALADQRAALRAWRLAMGELKYSTAALDASLQRYRNNLKTLGTRVAGLGKQAEALKSFQALEGSQVEASFQAGVNFHAGADFHAGASGQPGARLQAGTDPARAAASGVLPEAASPAASD